MVWGKNLAYVAGVSVVGAATHFYQYLQTRDLGSTDHVGMLFFDGVFMTGAAALCKYGPSVWNRMRNHGTDAEGWLEARTDPRTRGRTGKK